MRAQRVLVVDDTPALRMLIRLNLELEGFEVSEAVDGQDCLDQLSRCAPDQLPDLVTLDVVMPRLDGFSTAARLRADERTAAVPLVMVTTQAQPADLNRGRDIGVDAYVTKPFEPAHLVDTVRDVLARVGDC
ncbi:MAG: response regulator [Nocardioidaceae bacterium]